MGRPRRLAQKVATSSGSEQSMIMSAISTLVSVITCFYRSQTVIAPVGIVVCQSVPVLAAGSQRRPLSPATPRDVEFIATRAWGERFSLLSPDQWRQTTSISSTAQAIFSALIIGFRR